MTQPPNERPAPGYWTPPPAGSPQPQPQPQQWASPVPSQAAPPPYQVPGYQPDHTVFAPQPPTRSKRRAPLIASLVAVVALVGGGAVTYVALSDSSDSGAASPKAAVQNVVEDLENSDFVGVLDDLAPGERDALADPIRDDVQQLKNLHVLDDSADPSDVAGVTFHAQDLTYGAKPVVINDHVQIVELTGGRIDITGDTGRLPFSEQFRSAAHVADETSTRHLNVADNGPVRIATVEIGDRWYPSIFYTAADTAFNHRVPAAEDAIPAVGSGSPEDAVRDEVNALLRGDTRTALAHVSPSELGAAHDYGAMLLDVMPRWSDTGVRITQLDLTTSALSGGATRVGLKKLSLRKDGIELTVSIDGSCASVAAHGQAQRFCPKDAANLASGFVASGESLSAAQKTALADVFTGFTELGVATSQTGGQWYVDPVRSAVDVSGTLLAGMHGNDLFELATLGR